MPSWHVVGRFQEDRSPCGVCVSACELGGALCVHVRLCESGGGGGDHVGPTERNSRSSTRLGSLMQQLVSFIHAFFVTEHFFRERQARARPCPGGWGQRGALAHACSCLGGTPSPASRPTGKSRKPSPAESGFGGKDTGFGRNAVAGSCAPYHVTGPRQPNSCHSARRDPCISGWRG